MITMDEFKDLNEQVKKCLSEFGFKKPTKIQEEAIPQVLEGKNSLLIAPTGTGKTEAALFPIFSQYIDKNQEEGIKILYIAPLRALNRDMLKRLEKWGERLGIEIQVRHGDTSKRQRRKQALNPPDMLITTPETLQAILPGSRMKEHLKSINWIVVDEVHEIAESKRGTQLSIGLERTARLAGGFQRVGLSATVGSPKKVANFLAGSEREIEIIDTASSEDMSIRVESPMPSEEDAELSDKLNAKPTMIARLQRIRELIDQHNSTLTFVNTREASETLGSKLKFWDSEYPINVHHGSLSRDFRISAEEDFREGKLKGLICTSSMELGIDIGDIDFIIQYRSPRQARRLIQRLGRSGHEIGASSEGVILAADPGDVAESATIARRTLSHDLEKARIYELSYDVLAHQIIGLVLEGINDASKIFELIRRSYPYRNLSKSEFSEVADQLFNQGTLWREGKKLSPGKSSWKYYYTNLSMIPDTKQFQIENLVSGESIGTLDEEFVIGQAEVGVTFICKGEAWRVIEVEENKVKVEPVDDPYGAIPAWEGELIPVPFGVAQKVGEMRGEIETYLKSDSLEDNVAKELEKEYPVEKNSSEWFIRHIRNQLEEGPIPTDERLVIESYENFGILHSAFGTTVNKTLGQILAALISTRIGTSVGIKKDPYRIAFRFPKKGDTKALEKTLEELKPEHLEPILEKILEKSSVFRWRLLHVAKRFGAIGEDAEYSEIKGRSVLEAYKGTPLWDEAEREIRTEKIDVEKLANLLKKIQSGNIKIETVERTKNQGPTPLGLTILNELASTGEIVVPERAEREILDVLKRRLKNEQIKLFCLNCQDWSTLTRVRRLPDEPTCRNCGARMLALVPQRKRGVQKAFEKESNGKELEDEEKNSIRRARETANLILTHGKRAVTAMAGRGVGPTTASRILSKQYENEEDFYRKILEAERTYARTHRFWSD